MKNLHAIPLLLLATVALGCSSTVRETGAILPAAVGHALTPPSSELELRQGLRELPSRSG